MNSFLQTLFMILHFIPKTLLILLMCFNVSILLAEEKKTWLDEVENLRWAIDLSVKGIYNTETGHLSHSEAVGIDLHKVFTRDEGGDIGTLVLQGYFTKLNNAEGYPSFFKNASDVKFICRICNFNFSVLDQEQLKIRVGHFEIPFGLEVNLNTNGTLRQYNNGRDLGNKLDWGLALNGQFSWGGYEVAISRGHGVDWKSGHDTFIGSGRIELKSDYHSFLGLSGFHGRIKSKSGYINRTRIGLDAGTQFAFLGFLAEVSIGKDDTIEKINSLLEINLQNNTEKLLAYVQLKDSSRHIKGQSWDSIRQISVGGHYTPDRFWTLSGQWTHDFEVFEGAKRASVLTAQLRYRF